MASLMPEPTEPDSKDAVLRFPSFSVRLTNLREANNFTRTELSKRLGVSRVSIWKWEHDLARPKAEFIRLLAELYRMSPASLTANVQLVASDDKLLLSMPLGKRITFLRHARGLRAPELAASIGVTNMCLWKWENARSYPRPYNVTKLAVALETAEHLFIRGEFKEQAPEEHGR